MFGSRIITINLFHILVTGPVLVYIGRMRNDSSSMAFYLLGILACCIPLVVNAPQLKLSYWSIISILHYFIIMPSLIYIAYKQKLSESQYTASFITGLVIMGYHSYKAYGRLSGI